MFFCDSITEVLHKPLLQSSAVQVKDFSWRSNKICYQGRLGEEREIIGNIW